MATTLNPQNTKQRLLNALETGAKTDNDLARIIADYRAGAASIQDGTIRTIQQANAVSEVAMFDPTNEKRIGIHSLSKAQLDKGMAFLVTGIALQAYVATRVDPTNQATIPVTLNPRSPEEVAAMMAADLFGTISTAALAALANGEFSIRINRQPVLSKLSMQVFNNMSAGGGRSVGQMGLFMLENPILIKPEVPIEMDLRTAVATPASTLIEVVFYGAQTLAA